MIKYPYNPEDKEILFVGLDNPFMQAAKEMADNCSGCSWWPTGGVCVKDGRIIGRGCASRSTNDPKVFQPICPRYERKCPTGTGYELCKEVCKQQGKYEHSEYSCVEDALKNFEDTNGSDVYLFGHWWACKPCWDIMIENEVNNVYLLKDANKIFTTYKRGKLQDKIITHAQSFLTGSETEEERIQKIRDSINRDEIVWAMDLDEEHQMGV